jgi:hypothetical protein
MKANFEGFQCSEFASGVLATPASPMAPALESGAMVRNGTATRSAFNAPVNDTVSLNCPLVVFIFINMKIVIRMLTILVFNIKFDLYLVGKVNDLIDNNQNAMCKKIVLARRNNSLRGIGPC